MMESKKKFIIVGAGPSGLASALEASKNNSSVHIFESSEKLGGLSRTMDFEGCKFDVGPHRFFTKNNEVNTLFNEVLAEDQIRVSRLTRIFYQGKYFNYPITPINAFLGLGLINSIAIMFSYILARIKALIKRKKEDNFEEWVTNQFGSRLYRTFFKTYTEKVWGIPCTEISDQWASQRIKNLNLWEAVVRAFYGSKKNVVKTLVDEFGYPRLGCGQFYEKMASIIEANSGVIALKCPAVRIYHNNFKVSSIDVFNKNTGEKTQERGDFFLCSAPLTEMLDLMEPAPPKEVLDASKSLRYRDHIGVQLKMSNIQFPDNWIYIHSPDIKMARLSNYLNFSKEMSENPEICPLTAEYFTFSGDSVSSLTDNELIELAITELSDMNLAQREQFIDGFVVRSQKAYPVIDKASIDRVNVIRNWLQQFENLLPIGRSGMFKYNNQDHAIATGLLSSRTFLGTGNFDPWNVNIDAEYQESGPVS